MFDYYCERSSLFSLPPPPLDDDQAKVICIYCTHIILCNIYKQGNKSEEKQNLNKIIKELQWMT